jgi:uncharacterized protein YjdB
MIPKGTTASLMATGTYSDKTTKDITTKVTWTSAAPDTASVGPSTGVVAGVTVGATAVTATLDGVKSPDASITVTAATLSSIAITPTTTSTPPLLPIAKGNTTTLTATGIYSDGTSGNLSGTVTWISSDKTVVTVNNSGVATGAGIGTSSITATLNGKTSDAVTLTVTAPVIVSLAVTPSSPSVMVGSTVNLFATATYSDGTPVDVTSSASWSSTNTGIATVGLNSGVATGVATGSTTIFATTGGLLSPGITLNVTAFVPPTCTWDASTWDNCLWGN